MLFLQKKIMFLCPAKKHFFINKKINQHDKLFNIQKSKDLFPLIIHRKLINMWTSQNTAFYIYIHATGGMIAL